MNPFRLPILLLVLLPGLVAAAAPSVVCHTTYGGETHDHRVRPVALPYGVEAVPIGSHFLFKPVVEIAPAGLSAVKIYTYADLDHGPVPLHQASYPLPLRRQAGPFGFTGQQRVYEPRRDSELEYWCEIAPGGRR